VGRETIVWPAVAVKHVELKAFGEYSCVGPGDSSACAIPVVYH
jgi:hypothetical protein